MAFLSSIYKSLYDVQWLKANKDNRAAAWRYFFGFTAIITVITVVVMGINLFSEIKPVREKVLAAMPEFEAAFKGGELTITGLKQPFIYQGQAEGAKKFVIVADTVSTTTPELATFLKNEESGLLITKEKIELFDAGQQNGRVQYFENIPDTSFNRARIAQVITKFSRPPFLALLLVIVGFFVFVGFILSQLSLLVVVTIIAILATRIAKRDWVWNQLFTVGLYALTGPSILSFLLPFASVSKGHIPFLALLAFMLALVLTKDEPPAKPVETIQ
ncbi:MAG: DUF1189 domain-containing protein [Candidatus Magasanikbacteria bacterium]|nr:DUF1189 domain-containing protein [Candidatus Magasanikbacteria bacterium]